MSVCVSCEKQKSSARTVLCQVLRRVLGHGVREGGQLLDVLVVKPLDLKVQVHVVGCLTELMLLVLCAHTHTHKDTQTWSKHQKFKSSNFAFLFELKQIEFAVIIIHEYKGRTA